MTGRFDGRTILVVGAGTQPTDDPEAPLGNGRAIARRAAQEGALVVCADRIAAAAEETVRQIVDGGGHA
ncbi:MAG: oxidoreductase, partial [Acidimicrobiia bacterium]